MRFSLGPRRAPASAGRRWMPAALRRPSRLIAVAVALLSAVAPARAHDPFEIWSMGVLRADECEIVVTMAFSTAVRIIDPPAKLGAITLENFGSHRARFESSGAALFVLTANRKPLSPRVVTMELTDENDIVFHITYARPPAGRLHFHAAFLRKLGAGYGSIFDASEESGTHLGWEQLSFEYPNYEVSIPASPPKK